VANPRLSILGSGAVKIIQKAIDRLFDLIKGKYLGPGAVKRWETKGIAFDRSMSLPGMFEAASQAESTIPNTQRLNQLIEIADSYFESTRERTKAQAVHEIGSFLQDAHAGKIDTDLFTVLEGKLGEIYGQATSSISTIIGAETNKAKNIGLLDGIFKVNAADGVEDPTVFWVIVRDQYCCDECYKLHMLPNGITPRVWKISEATNGYHKKGQDFPSIEGLHPHCRCQITTLLPGYGFNSTGYVTFVSSDWDEYKHQRGG